MYIIGFVSLLIIPIVMAFSGASITLQSSGKFYLKSYKMFQIDDTLLTLILNIDYELQHSPNFNHMVPQEENQKSLMV